MSKSYLLCMLLLTAIPFSYPLSMGSFCLVKCHNVSRFTVWAVRAAEHFARWGGIWCISAFLMTLVSGWVAFQWVFVGLQKSQTILFFIKLFDTISSPETRELSDSLPVKLRFQITALNNQTMIGQFLHVHNYLHQLNMVGIQGSWEMKNAKCQHSLALNTPITIISY